MNKRSANGSDSLGIPGQQQELQGPASHFKLQPSERSSRKSGGYHGYRTDANNQSHLWRGRRDELHQICHAGNRNRAHRRSDRQDRYHNGGRDGHERHSFHSILSRSE